ncbi:MAG: GNAT family N-acetyltransferase, partial [Maioricimonas sp. JB045]
SRVSVTRPDARSSGPNGERCRMEPAIRLEVIRPSLVRSFDEGTDAFEAACDAASGAAHELIGQVLHATIGMSGPEGPTEPWCGYLAIAPTLRQVVGTCAFKGLPTGDGVEIAYFTFPPFEGRGYAVAMAGRLVQIAQEAAPGIRVFAQTLPEACASTRILEKTGFRYAGERLHPDDGRVWEWERGT